jgi:hypothetical protein
MPFVLIWFGIFNKSLLYLARVHRNCAILLIFHKYPKHCLAPSGHSRFLSLAISLISVGNELFAVGCSTMLNIQRSSTSAGWLDPISPKCFSEEFFSCWPLLGLTWLCHAPLSQDSFAQVLGQLLALLPYSSHSTLAGSAYFSYPINRYNN